MKHQFRSRKEVSVYLSTKGIDTSNWTEEKWLQINKGKAEIHMMALAEAMYDAYNESDPKELKAGEWHIPFGDNINVETLGKLFEENGKEGKEEIAKIIGSPLAKVMTQLNPTWFEKLKIKIATARCARVSYTVVGEEGKPDNYENDIKLHDRLAASGHWSPFEHCAKAMDDKEYKSYIRTQKGTVHEYDLEDSCSTLNVSVPNEDLGWSGNFRGFVQYRKMIPNENITK